MLLVDTFSEISKLLLVVLELVIRDSVEGLEVITSL